MKYSIGICTQPDRAITVAKLGADHIEPAFGLMADLDEPKFRAGLSCLRDSGLRADAMNGMLPRSSILYGSDAELAPTLEMVRRGMERAEEIGCHTVVFGSGGARNIPEGYTTAQAQQRLAAVLEQLCSIAKPHGIRIAIEPLRTSETNFIHTVPEALALASLLPQCDNLGINPDFYHMLEENDPFTVFSAIAPRLYHVHICAPDRHYPRYTRPEGDMDSYRDFFRALNTADYQGSVSIEGITDNMEAELSDALTIIRAARDSI